MAGVIIGRKKVKGYEASDIFTDTTARPPTTVGLGAAWEKGPHYSGYPISEFVVNEPYSEGAAWSRNAAKGTAFVNTSVRPAWAFNIRAACRFGVRQGLSSSWVGPVLRWDGTKGVAASVVPTAWEEYPTGFRAFCTISKLSYIGGNYTFQHFDSPFTYDCESMTPDYTFEARGNKLRLYDNNGNMVMEKTDEDLFGSGSRVGIWGWRDSGYNTLARVRFTEICDEVVESFDLRPS